MRQRRQRWPVRRQRWPVRRQPASQGPLARIAR